MYELYDDYGIYYSTFASIQEALDYIEENAANKEGFFLMDETLEVIELSEL